MKRRKGFMSNTVAELDRLNTRETQLVAGLAKLTAFVATEGDTAMDAEMALQNNCKIIAITYGHHSANRFESNKNILLVNSVDELRTCLLSLLLESQ